MRRLLVVITAVAVFCTAASGQQRLPNPGKQGMLRVWPKVGAWEVALNRLVYGDLGCRLLTGQINQRSGEKYVWGFRWREHEGYALIVTDNNQGAIAGSFIKLFIDQIPIGSYQITRRFGPESGFYAVMAKLPPEDQDKIISLIRVGGSVQFVTETFTYSAPLTGAPQGMKNMDACIVEATHLNPPPNNDATNK